MLTTATRDRDDYILNGSKSFVTGGGAADLYLVFAKTKPDEVSAFIVEKGTKGLKFTPPHKKVFFFHLSNLVSILDRWDGILCQ